MTTGGTTIKVPVALRDRLNERARAAGGTVAQVIEQLLADSDRARYFNAMRSSWQAQAADDSAEYMAEFGEFEEASLADLDHRQPPYES